MNSETPRILYYNPLLTDNLWDVGSFRCEETLSALAARGMSGTVASHRLSRASEIGGSFETVSLPKSPIDRMKSLIRIAERGDYHLIQERFRGGDVTSNGYGLAVSRRTGLPLVSELHNIGTPTSLLKTLHFLPASLRMSKMVLSYSAPTGYSILAGGTSRFVHVPNGYSERLVGSVRGREHSYYDMSNVARGRFVFGYFGGLTSEKGVGLILDAARCLEGDGRICFIFAGRGAMEQKLVKRMESSPNVVFLGLLSREETLSCMAQCRGTFAIHDAFQSRLGNSVKVIESIAVDVPPIISSDFEMPIDLDNKCVRVRKRTAPAIVDCVRVLVDTPKESIVDSSVREYSIDRIVQRVVYPSYVRLVR